MFRDLYYKLFFMPDLGNANGLHRFGERCMNKLLEKAKKRSSSARARTMALWGKLKSTEDYLKSVETEHLLDDDEYFGIRKRMITGTFFIIGIFVTECLLGYYSTLVLIRGEDFGISLLRWLIAIGLTFGGISSSEKLIEALLPIRHPKSSPSPPRSIPIIIMWSLMAFGVQLAIVSVAEARVRDIEGGHTGTIVYWGFIALSVTLPLIAGSFGWEISSFYDIYKQTRKYRKAQQQCESITRLIERNIQREEDFYNLMLTSYWARFNDFRSHKEIYNAKRGIHEENVNGYYDFEGFRKAATLRYGPVRKSLNHHEDGETIPKQGPTIVVQHFKQTALQQHVAVDKPTYLVEEAPREEHGTSPKILKRNSRESGKARSKKIKTHRRVGGR
jgi:hypothetical protein